MARKTLVALFVIAGLGLIVWAGVSNYRTRHAHKAVPGQAPQLALTPDNGTNADQEEQPMPPSPLLGKPAPEFTLRDLSGDKIALATYKGHPLLINFWATWCGPCKFEIPWLTTLKTKYAPQGFEILGISADELDPDEKGQMQQENRKIRATADALHINYPVLVGGDSIMTLYGGVDLLPQSFYVNRQGIVVAVITGAGSEKEAEADVQKALGDGA